MAQKTRQREKNTQQTRVKREKCQDHHDKRECGAFDNECWLVGCLSCFVYRCLYR